MAQQPPPPAAAPGSNKKLYTILSWALFPPIGSLIFLFVGKDDADVKYNAAQATVIHGISLIIYIITIILVVGITNNVYRNFTRHFSCCMPPHTIGHNKQCTLFDHHLRVFRDDIGHVIFVVFTLATNVC